MSLSENDERQSIRFSDAVDPDDTVNLTYEVEDDLTVEHLEVRIYRGAEFEVEIEPYVDQSGDPDVERRSALVTYRGLEYIAGDNDKISLDVSRGVEAGQTIGVELRNTDTTYTYHAVVDMTVEYAGGSNRIVDLLGGWL